MDNVNKEQQRITNLSLTRRVGEVVVLGTASNASLVRINSVRLDGEVKMQELTPNGVKLNLHSKRVGESFTLARMENVSITVSNVQGRQVRLSISAPADIRIDRLEVRARVEAGLPQRPRRTAANSSGRHHRAPGNGLAFA